MKKHDKAVRAPQSLGTDTLARILGGGSIGGTSTGGAGLERESGVLHGIIVGGGGLGASLELDGGIGGSGTVHSGGIGGFGRLSIAP
jgi:hypothetical protein